MRHPLILLDQELKSLGKEDDVSYKDKRPDGHPMRCWKCDSALKLEEETDLRNGISVQEYACVTCGRRWYGGKRRSPAIAA